LAVVLHPANVYPVRANAFDVSAVATFSVSADIEPVPPFELNVTVNEGSAVHCAYRVIDELNEYVASLAYVIPVPLARVFQPEKLYPAFAKPFDVRAVDELSVSAGIEPVPPLALKVTVYEVGGGDPPPPPPPPPLPPPDGTVVVVVGGLGGAGGTTTTVICVLTVTAFEREETRPLPYRLSASTVKR
jgi:hypothetical protein